MINFLQIVAIISFILAFFAAYFAPNTDFSFHLNVYGWLMLIYSSTLYIREKQ